MSASLSRAPAVTGKERAAITGREHVRTAQVIKPSRTRLNFRSASARWLVPHQATFPGSPGSGSVEARDAAEHGTLLLGDGRRLGSTGNTASSTRSPARSPQRRRDRKIRLHWHRDQPARVAAGDDHTMPVHVECRLVMVCLSSGKKWIRSGGLRRRRRRCGRAPRRSRQSPRATGIRPVGGRHTTRQR
jgi:hypothetical protein